MVRRRMRANLVDRNAFWSFSAKNEERSSGGRMSGGPPPTIRFVVDGVEEEEEEEKLESWVLLERESVGPNGNLKGITIMAWLMRVLRERRDNDVSPQVAFECFLISYQRLITPIQLLKLLETIYADPPRRLKAEVLDFVKYWLMAPDLTSSFSLAISTFAERIENELREKDKDGNFRLPNGPLKKKRGLTASSTPIHLPPPSVPLQPLKSSPPFTIDHSPTFDDRGGRRRTSWIFKSMGKTTPPPVSSATAPKNCPPASRTPPNDRKQTPPQKSHKKKTNKKFWDKPLPSSAKQKGVTIAEEPLKTWNSSSNISEGTSSLEDEPIFRQDSLTQFVIPAEPSNKTFQASWSGPQPLPTSNSNSNSNIITMLNRTNSDKVSAERSSLFGPFPKTAVKAKKTVSASLRSNRSVPNTSEMVYKPTSQAVVYRSPPPGNSRTLSSPFSSDSTTEDSPSSSLMEGTQLCKFSSSHGNRRGGEVIWARTPASTSTGELFPPSEGDADGVKVWLENEVLKNIRREASTSSLMPQSSSPNTGLSPSSFLSPSSPYASSSSPFTSPERLILPEKNSLVEDSTIRGRLSEGLYALYERPEEEQEQEDKEEELSETEEERKEGNEEEKDQNIQEQIEEGRLKEAFRVVVQEEEEEETVEEEIEDRGKKKKKKRQGSKKVDEDRENERSPSEKWGEGKSPLLSLSSHVLYYNRKGIEDCLPGGMYVKELVSTFNAYDWEMYSFLEIREFCDCAWTKEKTKAPFLHQLSKTFDQTSRWVTKCVLETQENFKTMFIYFLDAAVRLKRSKNLFRCFSIFSGIAHHSVSRISNKTILLDQASEVTRAYQKLEALFDARHENRTYRKLFKTLEDQQGVIPYLPVHLRDLAYLEEQETFIKDTKMLNMDKVRRSYETILSVLQFQHASLGDEERKLYLRPEKRKFLKANVFNDIEVEELYELSYAIQPEKGSAIGLQPEKVEAQVEERTSGEKRKNFLEIPNFHRVLDAGEKDPVPVKSRGTA